ncbi:Endothelial protein C receptor [Frankliniella fusca]|uniref:Endothelial protein C receptor n=1 Tax=Frankliniella fusca TaxID=407009 RepID=A0AAE1GW31_9NEOP|nr:Endothelial protein C receptor [Frankliniella fusca]
MSEVTEAMGKPDKPPPKKPGRKKVAKKHLAHQPKSRGRYVSKQAKQLTIDVAECIFSDEEERKEYVHQAVGTDSEGSVVVSSDKSEVNSTVVSSTDGHESSTVLSDSSPSTTTGSRPSSSLSRPGSSLNTSVIDSSVAESINNDSLSAPPDLDPMASIFFEVSSTCPQTIRKELFISFGGNVLVYVHCVLLPSFHKLFGLPSNPPVEFREESFSKYCDYCISLVKKFYQFQVCVGANDAEAREVWTEIGGGYIDSNPYREETYDETYRSASCSRLVDFRKGKRCDNCSQLMKTIARRKSFLLTPVAAPSTSNKYLSKQQANAKLELQSEIIRKKEKQIAWLRKRYQQILEAEGCNIDEDVSNFFSNVLSSSNLSQSQQMFLNEQWAAANKSDSRAHRWHPAMIRFALHLHMVSSAGYETLRDSGLIKLLCARTLFDYSHAIKATTGVNEGIVKLVHNDAVKFTEPYKQYHNLLCDGMHISQNFVFRSSDGSLVGVTYFDEIDKEMEVFEKYVEGKNAVPSEPQLATEMLAFMVSSQANRLLKQPDLAAYESVNDPRFDWLENTCLRYFQDWKQQVESKKDVEAASKEKMMLSNQILIGIEITIGAFIAAVKFFLDPNCIGGKFIMARIFSQDPLEQEFSKQRAGGGGNRNPNVSKFQSKMVSSAIQRNMGISRKRGNVTAEGKSGVEWSDEPVMKRVKTKK